MRKTTIVLLMTCIALMPVLAQLPEKGINITKPRADTILPKKIADKMAKGLKLNKPQKAEVLAINQYLSDLKAAARKESSDRATTGKRLQQIENMRDSLYKDVLKKDQFEAYQKDKIKLLNNNPDGYVIPSIKKK